MELLNFSPDQFKILLLIFIRISVVLFLFPVFGATVLPNLVKVGLSALLAFALYPVVQVDVARFPENPVQVAILVVSELFIGMVIGLCLRLFFAAVQLAGEIIGFQMGFSIINVVDPLSGTQSSLVDQFGYWVVMIVFLLLNGHHALISGLRQSFHIVDVGSILLPAGLLRLVLGLSSDMFVLAIKIGSPAMAALLLTSVSFGICARFVPQMNILIAAFPVKIIVGLMFLGICFQIAAIMTRSYLQKFPALIGSILTALGGG